MKKTLILFSIVIFTLCVFACHKKNNCTISNNVACQDTVPTQDACLAVFSRWFYNANTKTCTLVTYSGCSAKGFATKVECDSCACNN